MPEGALTGIFADIAEAAPRAIETVLAAMPNGFPEPLAKSILGGFEQRMKKVTAAFTAGWGGNSS